MKLMRVGNKGKERPALLDRDNRIRDLSSVLENITPRTLSKSSLAELAQIDIFDLPVISEPCRIAVPCAGVGKVICVGLTPIMPTTLRNQAWKCRRSQSCS